MRYFQMSIFLLFLWCSCALKKNNQTPEFVSNFENSVFAVAKLSYNSVGDPQAEGGISGTAFMLNDSTVITAHHVLSVDNFKPNPGFKFVQYWLIKRGTPRIIELYKNSLSVYPNIETTIIHLHEKIKIDYNVKKVNLKKNKTIYNFGHISLGMPFNKAEWGDSSVIIKGYAIGNIFKTDSIGKIVDIKKVSLKSKDIELNDKTCIQLSFLANQGMSGGPVITRNKIVGMMSFGFPPDSIFKKQVFAIHINEIIDATKK